MFLAKMADLKLFVCFLELLQYRSVWILPVHVCGFDMAGVHGSMDIK